MLLNFLRNKDVKKEESVDNNKIESQTQVPIQVISDATFISETLENNKLCSEKIKVTFKIFCR